VPSNQQHSLTRRGAGFFVLIILCSGAFLSACQQGKKPVLGEFQEAGIQYTTYEGAIGERKKVTLPGGINVILNSHSQLLVPPDFPTTHTLLLDGEAYFDTTAFPLTIKTNILVMTAKTPAAFKIRCFEAQQGATAYVLKGEVEVKKSYHSKTDTLPELLAPGNMVLANKEIDLMEKETYHPVDMETWLQDKLVFHDEPFMNAVRKLEEWYSTEIYVDGDPSHAGGVNGEFQGMSLKSVLENMKETAKFSFDVKKNKVMIEF